VIFRDRPGRTVPNGERWGCLGKVIFPLIPGDWRVVGERTVSGEWRVGVGNDVEEGESSGVRMGIGRAFLGCGERIAGVEVMVRGSLGVSDKLGGKSFPGTKVELDVLLDSDLLGTWGASFGGVSGDIGDIILGVEACCLSVR